MKKQTTVFGRKTAKYEHAYYYYIRIPDKQAAGVTCVVHESTFYSGQISLVLSYSPLVVERLPTVGIVIATKWF